MTKLPSDQDEFSRISQSPLPWFLLTVVLLAVAVVVRFVSLEDAPAIRVEASVLATDLLAGVLVSFVFYYIVAVLPEYRRKQLIKRNLRTNYLYIKKGLLQQIIWGSIAGGRHDLDRGLGLLDELMDVEKFKQSFSYGRQADEGYYAFSNHLNYESPEFQEILLRLAQLKSQVVLVLHNYPFRDAMQLEKFSFIDMRLTRLEKSVPGYDSSKPLLAFLFEIFSGWDMTHGYLGKDYILEAIDSL